MIHFLVSRKEYESIKSNKETMVIVEAFESCPYYHDHGYCIGCMYYGYGDEPWSGDDCPFGKEE